MFPFLNFFLVTLLLTRILLKSSVDIDEYLPKETKDWCIAELGRYGIDLNTLSGGDTILGGARAHVQAYQCLRDIVQHRMR